MHKTNFKGVYKLNDYMSAKVGKKFKASIRVNTKLRSLGFFDTAREAALAYDKVAILLGRQTNILKPING